MALVQQQLNQIQSNGQQLPQQQPHLQLQAQLQLLQQQQLAAALSQATTASNTSGQPEAMAAGSASEQQVSAASAVANALRAQICGLGVGDNGASPQTKAVAASTAAATCRKGDDKSRSAGASPVAVTGPATATEKICNANNNIETTYQLVSRRLVAESAGATAGEQVSSSRGADQQATVERQAGLCGDNNGFPASAEQPLGSDDEQAASARSDGESEGTTTNKRSRELVDADDEQGDDSVNKHRRTMDNDDDYAKEDAAADDGPLEEVVRERSDSPADNVEYNYMATKPTSPGSQAGEEHLLQRDDEGDNEDDESND